MKNIIPIQKNREKAILIGIKTETIGYSLTKLQELGKLVRNLGIHTQKFLQISLKEQDSRWYLRTGKVEEIKEKIKVWHINLVIFDSELSPSQQRNLENEWKLPVIDRREVILEVFALRASTREAMLQVGLARMQYSLPRLTRAWTHLSRQRGGSRGNRGKGETQLENDRRLVLERISQLKKKIKNVVKQREERRKKRSALPLVSVVGYTNAGKSSLMNALCKTRQLSADKLFATLDPATRSFTLSGGKKILLTDTVGFISGLPHNLIDAFRSTLEEARLADIIIHVADIASPQIDEEISVTNNVLESIGADKEKILLVFNKTDQADEEKICFMRAQFPQAVFISSIKGLGLNDLKKKILYRINESSMKRVFEFPLERLDLYSRLHSEAIVIDKNYKDDKIRVTAILNLKNYHSYADYLLARHEKSV